MDTIKSVIQAGAMAAMTEKEFFEREIERWKNSESRKN